MDAHLSEERANNSAGFTNPLIAIGSLVVLRKLGKGRKYCYKQVVVEADTRVSFKGSPAIGLVHLVNQRYGTLFKITQKGGLEPVTDVSEFDQFEDHLVSDLNAQNPLSSTSDPVSDRDNRNIVDSSQNQALTVEDLAQLKQTAESGRSVIERLIDSSANFEQKTSFSQEKYVRKKKEKYLDYVAALEPSCRVLSEIRGRGLNLRFDMLSQLIAYANVHCATRALLVDDSYNLLLTQAVCERLDAGSGGRLCLLTASDGGATEPFKRLRERCRQVGGDQTSGMLKCLPLAGLQEALGQRRGSRAAAAAANFCPSSLDETGGPNCKVPRLDPPSSLLAESDWDCLLVASRFNPLSLMPLLELLLPGKPFAFHCPHQDALVALGEELNFRKLAESGPLLLFDSFCRPWQLLPGRCRPAMRMEAMGSGFALVGRKSGPGEDHPPEKEEKKSAKIEEVEAGALNEANPDNRDADDSL